MCRDTHITRHITETPRHARAGLAKTMHFWREEDLTQYDVLHIAPCEGDRVQSSLQAALCLPSILASQKMLSSCRKCVISLPKWSWISQKVMVRASSSSFIKIPSLFGSKTSKTADVREEKQATPVRKEYFVPRKFVPMTRKALIRRIVEDEKLVNPTDRHYFQGLAEVLDKSIAGSFHAALGELKVSCKKILAVPGLKYRSQFHGSRVVATAPSINYKLHIFP